MSKNFDRYSNYYDLLYAEKNYEKEASYVDHHIKNFIPEATTLLELGSGTGNHANHFCRAGYQITGIERSSEMAAIAKAKNIEGFEVIVDDMTSFDLDVQCARRGLRIVALDGK